MLTVTDFSSRAWNPDLSFELSVKNPSFVNWISLRGSFELAAGIPVGLNVKSSILEAIFDWCERNYN